MILVGKFSDGLTMEKEQSRPREQRQGTWQQERHQRSKNLRTECAEDIFHENASLFEHCSHGPDRLRVRARIVYLVSGSITVRHGVQGNVYPIELSPAILTRIRGAPPKRAGRMELSRTTCP